MIIKPRVKDYLCLTAHPEGCKKNVEDQIAYVKAQGEIPGDAKKVLVIGCSTGYGLASRIVAAFGCHADTLGIMFERPKAATILDASPYPVEHPITNTFFASPGISP